MYFADSPKQTIWRYTFDRIEGSLSDGVVFATTEGDVYPDGAVTDAEGYLWNAQWGGSQIVRYAPDGCVDAIIPVPVSQPTCVAFGGPSLDMLCVTSAQQDLDAEALASQPTAGDMHIFASPIKGQKNYIFGRSANGR